MNYISRNVFINIISFAFLEIWVLSVIDENMNMRMSWYILTPPSFQQKDFFCFTLWNIFMFLYFVCSKLRYKQFFQLEQKHFSKKVKQTVCHDMVSCKPYRTIAGHIHTKIRSTCTYYFRMFEQNIKLITL